jgi:hypothetical protein
LIGDRVHGYVAPGLLAHRTRLPDITVATDDVATTRWQRCTFCQGSLADFSFRVWQQQGLVVGVVLCPQCQRLGDALVGTAVDLMLRARYDNARFGNNISGGDHGPHDPVGTAAPQS